MWKLSQSEASTKWNVVLDKAFKLYCLSQKSDLQKMELFPLSKQSPYQFHKARILIKKERKENNHLQSNHRNCTFLHYCNCIQGTKKMILL